MAINIRRVGEVADGSVTSAKLAPEAVIAGKIAAGAVVSGTIAQGAVGDVELADDAVIESKIKDNAIKTAHLQDYIITLAKANNDVRLTTFTGDETEVSVVGTTETAVKELGFPKSAGKFEPTDVRFLATLKSSSDSIPAIMNIYIDEELSPRASFSTTATSYQIESTEFDISDLAAGKHSLTVKLVSSGIAETAYNDMIDVMMVK